MHGIEYKSTSYPYHYEYLRDSNGNFTKFDSITDARKKCMRLIANHTAIVAFVRPDDEGVYMTRDGRYVLERRKIDKWNYLNKDGTCGSPIRNIRNVDLIRSAW